MNGLGSDSAANESPFQRGHVVWVEWIGHLESGPYLILSDDRLRNHGEEYLGVPLSTVEQENTVPIRPEDWRTGGLNEPSFALSWHLQSIPARMIERGIGALSSDIVDEIAQSATSFLELTE
jgi:mRNA-degrading endonuclease toxin of MazEF toxin-antitoxin module